MCDYIPAEGSVLEEVDERVDGPVEGGHQVGYVGRVL